MALQRPGPDWRGLGNSVFRSPGGRAIYLLIAALIVVFVLYNSTFVYVGPNQVAIKMVVYGPKKGVQKEPLTCGFHLIVPGAERLYLFPTDIQVLSLTNDSSERGAADKDRAPPLNIQTSEGYNVTVDVSVLYRIEDAHKVMETVGPGRLFEGSLVVPRSEQLLRKRLGELDAEEFYDVTKRLAKEKLALEDLNTQLVPNGIHVMQVFVRKYVYDQRYQQAIEQRKIQDQTVFMNKAEAEMASAKAEKDRVVAVGQAAVRVELSHGDAEKQNLGSQAELYSRTQKAEGDKVLALAEAEGTRLESAALQGKGSEYLVGLKMADALKGTRVIVLPSDGEGGTNPLDLKAALKRFDVTP